jgi:catechol 2,3-dioxygenase-like lactoylglutathione lyase family enzyme
MPDPEDSVPPLLGMRHVALWVSDVRFDAVVRFYREAIGMRVDWQPDRDNVYLTSGADNIALHRVGGDVGESRLDHVGFLVPTAEDVPRWHARIAAGAEAWEVKILAPVKRHRDGATSFYLADPAGTKVQIIHLPSVQR